MLQECKHEDNLESNWLKYNTRKVKCTEMKFDENSIDSLAFSLVNKNVDNLYHMNLSFNNIKQLHHNWFNNLINISILDLSYNNIEIIESGIFDKNIKLNYLILVHNNIYKISFNFGILEYLYSLDIAYNNLTYLDKNAFIGLFSDTISKHPEILVHDNPLECGCEMTWVYNIHISHDLTFFNFYETHCKIKELKQFEAECVFSYYDDDIACLPAMEAGEKFYTACASYYNYI